MILVSATPGKYEKERQSIVIEQVVRPTGLVDPEITVKPASSQVDALLGEIHQVVDRSDDLHGQPLR